MSDFASLLPSTASPLLRAIEQTNAEPLIGLEAPIQTLWDVNTCPVELLPWLAWAFSVEVWKHDWEEATKREVICSAIAVHRLKGTRQSVEIALGALGFRIDLVEAWEEGGDPHTFRLDAYGDDVFAAGFQIDAHLLDTVTRLIENVKPVRSHFSLRIGESFTTAMTAKVGQRQRRRHVGALSPQPRAHEIEQQIGLASGLRRRARHCQTLVPHPRPHTSAAALAVKPGLRARQCHQTTYRVTPREGAAYAA